MQSKTLLHGSGPSVQAFSLIGYSLNPSDDVLGYLLGEGTAPIHLSQLCIYDREGVPFTAGRKATLSDLPPFVEGTILYGTRGAVSAWGQVRPDLRVVPGM